MLFCGMKNKILHFRSLYANVGIKATKTSIFSNDSSKNRSFLIIGKNNNKFFTFYFIFLIRLYVVAYMNCYDLIINIIW